MQILSHLSFKYLLLTDASIFTIVPETQYVYLNDNVTFECATNLTGYTLEIQKVNDISSIGTSTIDLPDGGSKVTITFPVTSNGTRVRCLASYGVNTLNYTEACVYTQGQYNY